MGKNKFFKTRALTPAQQLYYMQLCWPDFLSSRSGQVLTWTGNLTPTPISSTYKIRLTYDPPVRPQVQVVSPKLQSLPGKKIPHRFADGRLCLHLPVEWNGGRIIAHTILHWTAFWLFFYGVWLLTGEWEGGGHEPPGEAASDE